MKTDLGRKQPSRNRRRPRRVPYRQSMQRSVGLRTTRLATAAASALGALFATFIAIAPASASQASHPCNAGVLVIGVRGTNAPAGSSPTPSGHAWHAGGWGNNIVGIANYFTTNLPYNSEWPTYIESINYPAKGGIDEPDSVMAGANQLAAELRWIDTVCAVRPLIVIAGHSQGAEVIDLGLADPSLSARIRGQIRAVAEFGDPRYLRGYLIDYKPPAGSAQGLFSMSFGTMQALVNNYKYTGWDQGSTSPSPTTLSKIRSYCKAGDFYCQSNVGDANLSIHNSYAGLMPQVASWMNYRLMQPN